MASTEKKYAGQKNIGVSSETHRRLKRVAMRRRWSLATTVDEAVKKLDEADTASPVLQSVGK